MSVIHKVATGYAPPRSPISVVPRPATLALSRRFTHHCTHSALAYNPPISRLVRNNLLTRNS